MTGIVYTQRQMYAEIGGDSLFGKIAERHWHHWYDQAAAYIWGRQDACDVLATRIFSHDFAGVYALANTVTDGMAPPLQAAFHEYVETGRILVRVGRRVTQVYAPTRNGTSWAECVVVPWVGSEGSLPYWPGIAPVHEVPQAA
jgi:hypothetical protein